MTPALDAVDSVVRKYMRERRSKVKNHATIAKKMLQDSGLTRSYKGRVVVILGADSEGADEEVVCEGYSSVLRVVASAVSGA